MIVRGLISLTLAKANKVWVNENGRLRFGRGVRREVLPRGRPLRDQAPEPSEQDDRRSAREAADRVAGQKFEVERPRGEPDLRTNLIYYGDNLNILRDHIPSNSVDFDLYLDPPFNSAEHFLRL